LISLTKSSVPDAPEPPRKTYAFKPKEFERVNAETAPEQPTPAANDVYAIRRELREREVAAGMDALAPAPKKKSRRRRDFWLCLIGLNALMIAVTVGSGFNIVVAAYAFSGMVLLSLGLTWTMWFVMDDY
jgi:hypothetical protein